jgi:uncharacterized protein
MKYVVVGESSGAPMEKIMSVYPRHKVVADALIARGVVIGIGHMTIFRTREAAEEFVKTDPFNLEGLVKSYTIREWHDELLK